jgi:hypothetical protein
MLIVKRVGNDGVPRKSMMVTWWLPQVTVFFTAKIALPRTAHSLVQGNV